MAQWGGLPVLPALVPILTALYEQVPRGKRRTGRRLLGLMANQAQGNQSFQSNMIETYVSRISNYTDASRLLEILQISGTSANVNNTRFNTSEDFFILFGRFISLRYTRNDEIHYVLTQTLGFVSRRITYNNWITSFGTRGLKTMRVEIEPVIVLISKLLLILTFVCYCILYWSFLEMNCNPKLLTCKLYRKDNETNRIIMISQVFNHNRGLGIFSMSVVMCLNAIINLQRYQFLNKIYELPDELFGIALFGATVISCHGSISIAVNSMEEFPDIHTNSFIAFIFGLYGSFVLELLIIYYGMKKPRYENLENYKQQLIICVLGYTLLIIAFAVSAYIIKSASLIACCELVLCLSANFYIVQLNRVEIFQV